MTLPTGTYTTYATTGIKESFQDAIYNIAPTDTPFLSMLKRENVGQKYYQWQTDSLATAANNKQLEGDDASGDTQTATVLSDNYCQISRKVVVVAGTNQASNKWGRGKSELAYLIGKAGKEIKRDMEFALTQNGAFIAGDASTARQTRGLEGWIATNDLLGGGSPASPNPAVGSNTAPTDGDARALTESLVTQAHQLAYTQGGNPKVLMSGPYNRRIVDTFNGYSTRTSEADSKKVVATIEVYVNSYGTLKVVTNRFQRDRTLFGLDMDYWSLGVLRPIQQKPLADTGDNTKRMILGEYCLISKQEKASFAVRDLTTS